MRFCTNNSNIREERSPSFHLIMCRINFLILLILKLITFIHGQKAQSMAPVHVCSLTTTTLRCPVGYVIIVKSAFFGVTQIPGLCTYSSGDCTADAMDIILCDTDSTRCNVYVPRIIISQCSNQYNNYVVIEYDCVPISIMDSTKEYDICQSGTGITSDHGIIKSRGYPTQFQTTAVECIRPISVPNNKTIRLWLTDLSIGSISGNCTADYIKVIDSIQTYQHCNTSRYTYPYLCSSTIMILYYVTTQLENHRGVRMYFEIVDRLENDSCPNSVGTLTSTPYTTLSILPPSLQSKL